MAQWIIRVIGKRRKEIDKHLLVQAVLALGHHLKEQEVAKPEVDRNHKPKEDKKK